MRHHRRPAEYLVGWLSNVRMQTGRRAFRLRGARLRSSALVVCFLVGSGVAWGGAAQAAAGAASPRLVFHGNPDEENFGTVDLIGLPESLLSHLAGDPGRTEGAPELFDCYTEEAIAREGWPAVLGTYAPVEDAIRFRPRYPFSAGGVYACRFDPERWGLAPISLQFKMPSPERPAPARVTAIHPSSVTVPENLLRIYIHFSTPMQRKGIEDHVRLFDSRGEEVVLPFVEVENGLWDTDSRRLTLFFHPGRIKRGVGPHESMGPPLRAGETYRLVVDADLRDAQGYPVAGRFEKDLQVVAADRRSPDPGDWNIVSPQAPGDPVALAFPEPLDHALLGRFIAVRHAGGAEVIGQIEVPADGSGWSFTPARPWEAGRYALVVNPALEDLAGNTLRHLFDEETKGDLAVEKLSEPLQIEFSIPAP